MHGIDAPRDQIADFCRRHRISMLAFFGSLLRDNFGPESDVDVLVEFEEETQVGLIALSAMELELGGILRRRVDLRTPAELSRYFREDVLRTAVVQYVA